MRAKSGASANEVVFKLPYTPPQFLRSLNLRSSYLFFKEFRTIDLLVSY